MTKLENPNWAIRKDINFVYFGKCVNEFVQKIEKKCSHTMTYNFLKLNGNLFILQIKILLCGFTVTAISVSMV